MLAVYMDDARRPRALLTDVREIRVFRQRLEESLLELQSDEIDLLERTQQAIASLYRLEWAMRYEGPISVAVPSGNERR